ncbi:F204A protein, partial [Notiomystis cincta]|nr:F204A protein [Notiomystis cincta]
MWSGLLPPGLNESDIDLSSDDEDELPNSCSKENAKEETERVQGTGQDSNASTEPIVAPVAGEGSESQTSSSGASGAIWNKYLELQRKYYEMKMQAKEEMRHRKRKRHRKGDITSCGKGSGCSNDLFVCLFVFRSQQSEYEDRWKELIQYFGINDRFELSVDSRAPQKSGLELSIEKCVAEGDIAKAEELSDRLATREV